jgi:hypothetical protein
MFDILKSWFIQFTLQDISPFQISSEVMQRIYWRKASVVDSISGRYH